MKILSLARSPLVRDFVLSNGVAAASTFSKGFDPGLKSFVLGSLISSLRSKSNGLPLVSPVLADLSWSLILQSSLVLSMWSQSSSSKAADASDSSKADGSAILLPDSSMAKRKQLMAMLLAFCFGTIGSVIGSLMGFKLISFNEPSTSSVWKMASACLAASYVGGTANFFDTAKQLSPGIEDMRILNLIAGVDIFVMVAFFSVLLWFRGLENKDIGKAVNVNVSHTSSASSMKSESAFDEPGPLENLPEKAFYFSGAVSIAYMASRLQRFFDVPGVSVLLSVSLASLTVVISKPLEDFLRSSFATKGFYFFQDPTKPVEELTLTETAGWQKLRKDDKWAGQMTQTRVLKGASEYALSLFYAIIGLGCQLQDLPKVGGKVLLLMFSTLAVHLSVLVISCRGWNRLIGNKLKLKVDVDTQIMASNACVGGPATAAAMAAMTNSALILPSTVAGILGYIIGSTIGCGVYKFIA